MNKSKREQGGFISIVAVISVILLIYVFTKYKDNGQAKFFWNAFTKNMNQIQKGQPNDWQIAAPVVNFK